MIINPLGIKSFVRHSEMEARWFLTFTSQVANFHNSLKMGKVRSGTTTGPLMDIRGLSTGSLAAIATQWH